MKTVRLYHPVTGATYDAPESAVDILGRSGWEPADQAAPAEPVAGPVPVPVDSKTPRGRRTSKEDS